MEDQHDHEDDRPTAEFPSSIDPLRDKPEYCPPWCLGHSIAYASDFTDLGSAEEYELGKRLFQEHMRNIAHRTLWTVVNYTDQDFERDGVFRHGTQVLREGGGWYSIDLSRGRPRRLRGHRGVTREPSGMARA